MLITVNLNSNPDPSLRHHSHHIFIINLYLSIFRVSLMLFCNTEACNLVPEFPQGLIKFPVTLTDPFHLKRIKSHVLSIRSKWKKTGNTKSYKFNKMWWYAWAITNVPLFLLYAVIFTSIILTGLSLKPLMDLNVLFAQLWFKGNILSGLAKQALSTREQGHFIRV